MNAGEAAGPSPAAPASARRRAAAYFAPGLRDRRAGRGRGSRRAAARRGPRACRPPAARPVELVGADVDRAPVVWPW
ncbi:MAG: hypothetical protein MZV64_12505 [Ignavibacteriales bacterium]|nr:hypothetical protein [Ignavibacteriales bacterium]